MNKRGYGPLPIAILAQSCDVFIVAQSTELRQGSTGACSFMVKGKGIKEIKDKKQNTNNHKQRQNNVTLFTSGTYRKTQDIHSI